jgi:hypothetical protein
MDRIKEYESVYLQYILEARRSGSGCSGALRMMTLILLIQPSINSFSFGFARHAVGARAEYGMALTGMSPACFSCLQQTATDTASRRTIKDQSRRGRCILLLLLQRLECLFIRLSALWSLHHYIGAAPFIAARIVPFRLCFRPPFVVCEVNLARRTIILYLVSTLLFLFMWEKLLTF